MHSFSQSAWKKLCLFYCIFSVALIFSLYIFSSSLLFPASLFAPFSLPVFHLSNVQQRHPRFRPAIQPHPSPRSEQIILAQRRNILNWDVVKLGILLDQLVLTNLNHGMESDILRKQGEREWTLGDSDTICSSNRWEWSLHICATQWPWEHRIIGGTVSSVYCCLGWMMTQESVECFSEC